MSIAQPTFRPIELTRWIGATAQFSSPSKRDLFLRYDVKINTQNGVTYCSCRFGDFHHDAPKFHETHRLCLHRIEAVNYLKVIGAFYECPAVTRPCHHCEKHGAESDMVDDNGNQTGKWICEMCVRRGQVLDDVEHLDLEDDEPDEPEFEAAELRGMMGQMSEASI